MRRLSYALSLTLLCTFAGCIPWLLPPEQFDPTAQSWILKWNHIAIDASGLDHTPTKLGDTRVFGHQLGPTRSSRAMAIVHIAMFEAVNAIVGGYESYTGTPPAPANTSMRAAICQAAHDTLSALYPSHSPNFAKKLTEDLDSIPDGPAKFNGVALGQQTAAAILSMRAGDGSEIDEPYVYSDLPGRWRVDPLNPDQEALGNTWSQVQPFVMTSADQFRVPPPPPIDSVAYAIAYEEVMLIGGDGVTTPTLRRQEQSLVGIFWAYDGTPSLCAPPRLYNQIAVHIGLDYGLDVIHMAHMLALVNVAMADAAIAIWESKYYYDYWRPVTGIREADPGTGPTGLGDNNPLTQGDVNFTPLGAPASNLTDPNFTPPFPAYPSGHAGFGGALFQVLREYYGTDRIPFTFISDELNGVTIDNQGNRRPLLPRHFPSLSAAEEENGQSRIYLGIHWAFDKTAGITQGNRVGNFVNTQLYRRKR